MPLSITLAADPVEPVAQVRREQPCGRHAVGAQPGEHARDFDRVPERDEQRVHAGGAYRYEEIREIETDDDVAIRMGRRERHDPVPLAKAVYRTVRRDAIEQPVQDAALRFAQPAFRDFDEAAAAAALVVRHVRVVMQRRGAAARVDAPVVGQPVERRRAHAEPAGQIAGRRPLRHVAAGERRRQGPLDQRAPYDANRDGPIAAVPREHESRRIGEVSRKRIDVDVGPARTEACDPRLRESTVARRRARPPSGTGRQGVQVRRPASLPQSCGWCRTGAGHGNR